MAIMCPHFQSEATQRPLRGHSEATQRPLRGHSEATQRPLSSTQRFSAGPSEAPSEALRGSLKVIRVTQRPSTGPQRPSEGTQRLIRGYQRHSEAIRGHQRPLSGTQRHSEALRSTQCTQRALSSRCTPPLARRTACSTLSLTSAHPPCCSPTPLLAAAYHVQAGQTPLHCAAQCSSSVAVVRALLAAYPEAATATDNVRRHHPCCRVHQRPSAVIRGSSDVIKGNQVYTFALRGQ